MSEPVRVGTIQRTILKSDNRTQDNRLSSSEADRPADVPQGQDPHEAKAPNRRRRSWRSTAAPTAPAIDAQGNADCEIGQRGYLEGPLAPGGRYGPRRGRRPARGLGPFDLPGLRAAPTRARELGIDNLKDVP